MNKKLNVRAKTMKLLGDNIMINLHDLGFGNGLLGMNPKYNNKRMNK